MTARTYLVYTDSLDAGKAKLYVEMGECAAVPAEIGGVVRIDDVKYRVVAVEWDVFSKPSTPRDDRTNFPQQCATVLVRRMR